MNISGQSLYVKGCTDFIVAVAQQLSWLVAACRESSVGLDYSHISFNEDKAWFQPSLRTFRISCETSLLEPSQTGSCWNSVVGSASVASGFPIPSRSNNEKGLEIPLEIMAALGGVPLVTKYKGGYLLKSRTIAFIPVERIGSSVQWHLVEKMPGRLEYEDIAELCPFRLLTNVFNEQDLLSTRAFLGWCPEATNNLGE